VKIDFGNITNNHIEPGKVFYLYGNYKKSFDVFCDFVVEKFRSKFKYPLENLNTFHVSVSECTKIMNSQCDLFGTQTRFFCIRNIEDNHIDRLTELFRNSNDIFILNSGDYRKTKKITDFFLKHDFFNAIASFKNDLTLMSLCKMMLPSMSCTIYSEIVKIINDTDEELFSLFRKISLLLSEENLESLKEYTTYKESFLESLDPISLIRYLLRLSIKEKIYDKKQDVIKFNLSKENVIEHFLKSEIYQKTGVNLEKCYILKNV